MPVTRCDKLRDSLKPGSNVTISLTLSGTYVESSSGGAITVSFPETTRTLTLTREAFDAREYYLNGTPPEEGKFYLVAPCCCWQCRSYELFRIDETSSSNSIVTDGFLFPWSKLDAPVGGPSDTTTGDLSAAALFSHGVASGFGYWCKSTDDAGEGVDVSLIGSADGVFGVNGGFSVPPLDWEYEDSLGNTEAGSDYSGLIRVPGPFTDPINLDFCADTTAFERTIVYNGFTDGGEEGISYTVTDLTLKVSFALT